MKVKNVRHISVSGIQDLLTAYYTKDEEIDITLFKVLGTAGILISIISGIQSIVTNISVAGGLIDFFAALASILLLWFVDRTGKYVYAYIITSISIFMILFSILFFEMGGMDGSMPYFFAFGIVFVFLMFKGKLLVIMEILQVAVYTFICVYSVRFPESVTSFASADDRFIDQLTGILFSGVGIGLIFLAYIAQYRKQKLLADEANLAKSRFLANMSHEIRTPINMMMGMNEMIMRESENEAIKAYASNAEDAGKQLISVVDQILQYSKLEVGKDSLVNGQYDLVRMLGGLRDFFGKEAAAKDLSFEMTIDEGIEPILVGDMRKISQILTNLLSNAVKYTREGYVSLNVRNLGRDDSDQRIAFEVSDSGIGIEGSELERIFESFERTDLLRNRNIEGTGLGLAIAQELAAMMNTFIDVESVYGKGSTFRMELKQRIGDRQAMTEMNMEGGSFVAPDARVLAVDDNEMNLNVLRSLLKKTMLVLDTAASPVECYEKCRMVRYDLILMDLMMPDIDGVQAMKHLRAFEGYNHVPMIALTADVSVETEDRMLAEGFDGYITKPVDWRELEACLMEKLPEETVIKTNGSVSAEIDEEVIEEVSAILKEADIDLSEGLHYMDGDIVQYARVAEYFITQSDSGISDLSECIGNEDFDGATYILHSLKGNARNVGSIELHYLSKRLEKRCRENDTEYVKKSSELLIFEWTRVREGLERFLQAFGPVRAEIENEICTGSDSRDEEHKLPALLEAIERYQQIPAVDCINDILQTCEDDDKKRSLEAARDLISKIEFEEAEAIVRQLL